MQKRNKNFNLKALARQYYHVEKRRNGYSAGHISHKKALGNRAYLMPIMYDRNDIWVAPNEIFYTTANAAQLRGKTFLTQNGMKYMKSYTLNDNDKKELRRILPNFQLKEFHKRIKVTLSAQNYQNELIFYSFNYYGSFGEAGYPVVGFEAPSPELKNRKNGLVQIREFL